MCFAVPARVVAVEPGIALVERGGERFAVSLHLLLEPVHVGDHLAVQAQRQAVAKLTAEEAEEVMAIYAQILERLQ